MPIKSHIRTIEHYPKQGVMFRDITTLLKDPVGFRVAIDEFVNRFPHRILHAGYCETFEQYASFLWKADICPVTSIQDFFGISIAEAVYCNTYPLLPNRLAYPEIYNKESNEDLFYTDKKNLTDKIETLIKGSEDNSKDISKDLIQVFDWTNMISEYDKLFSSILK